MRIVYDWKYALFVDKFVVPAYRVLSGYTAQAVLECEVMTER